MKLAGYVLVILFCVPLIAMERQNNNELVSSGDQSARKNWRTIIVLQKDSALPFMPEKVDDCNRKIDRQIGKAVYEADPKATRRFMEYYYSTPVHDLKELEFQADTILASPWRHPRADSWSYESILEIEHIPVPSIKQTINFLEKLKSFSLFALLMRGHIDRCIDKEVMDGMGGGTNYDKEVMLRSVLSILFAQNKMIFEEENSKEVEVKKILEFYLTQKENVLLNPQKIVKERIKLASYIISDQDVQTSQI